MRQLEKHGHEVTFRSVGDEAGSRLLAGLRGEDYDIIVGQRLNTRLGLESWNRAAESGTRLVYETDDDVFNVTRVNNALSYRLYQRADIREALTRIMQAASLITVTTEHLAGVLREQTGNPNITVLPNCVPAWVLDLGREESARPAIGWAGSTSHGADIGQLVNPVRRFLRRYPGWDFRLGGADFRPAFRGGDRVTFRPWVPVFRDPVGYYSTIDFDIGLIPLADNPFSRGKSNVKALEYAARGIPSVAADCEVYRSFIRHGINGFLVRHEHEWLTYMSLLASDGSLRRTMGETARQDVCDWTIERNYQRWEKAYESLLAGIERRKKLKFFVVTTAVRDAAGTGSRCPCASWRSTAMR